MRWKHGHASRAINGRESRFTPEFRAWSEMIRRCENRRSEFYGRYGGRGVEVCARWRTSFSAFLADVGLRPSPQYSVDRIDNDGNYEPGNVRWATASQQAANRGSTKLITFRGETMCVAEWARRLGLHRHTLYSRFAWGWPVERALTEPKKPGNFSKRTSQ